MEGVIVPSSPGNSTRLRTRLRSSSSDFLVRKKAQSNRNYALNHKNYRNAAASRPFRNAGLRPKHPKHHHVLRHDSNGNASKSVGFCFNGKYTREVYHAICGRLGHTPHIPGDSVQALFNDMHLYPSKSEVSEMLHCARQVGRRNGSYLTFGEFCVLAREMQRPKLSRKPQAHKQNNKCTSKCEVFLGGSCNPTTWRTDTAIPELQKHGISYYNPQVSIWAPELVAQEHDAKQSASLLLYVIDSQTRSVAGMIEVGYLVAAGRCVVLVACPYREGQTIMDEPITQREYVDLANGQTSLLALVKSQGIKVHKHLSSALQCTASILRNTSMNNGMTAEEQVTHKLRKLRETFDTFDSNHSGEIQLMDVVNAYHLLTNKKIDMRSLCNYLRIATSDVADTRISFDQFCALVAEFSTDGCESFTPDGRRIDWISHPLNRNCSMNNNVHYNEIKEPSAVNKPENRIIDIYLGGSCSTQVPWRENVIPLLKKQGITYYNPAIREIEEGDVVLNGSLCGDSVCESNVLRWKRAMDKSTVLLFYITNDTRSLTTMILAAHYIGLERNVVLCIEHLPHDDIVIDGEKLTKQAIKDYNRGRVYLHDLAKRKQVPVFDNITEAVQMAADRSRSR